MSVDHTDHADHGDAHLDVHGDSGHVDMWVGPGYVDIHDDVQIDRDHLDGPPHSDAGG